MKPQLPMFRNPRRWLLAGLSLLPFIIALFLLVGDELYWDEACTLRKYIFKGFGEIVGSYSAPNNHIFFNLTNLWFLDIFGSYEFDLWQYRFLPVAYSLLTLFFVYKSGRLFGEDAGWIALGGISTALPFLAYAFRFRGYTLTFALAAIFLHSFLLFEREKKKIHLPVIALATALLIYTLPSNIVFPFLAGAYCLALWPKGFRFDFESPYFRIMLALLCGVALAALLYLPAYDDIMARYVTGAETDFTPQTPFSGMGVTMDALWSILSYRLLLLLPILFALHGAREKRRQVLLLLLLTMGYPLFFPATGYGFATNRIYILSAIPLAILAALSFRICLDHFRPKSAYAVTAACLAYMTLTALTGGYLEYHRFPRTQDNLAFPNYHFLNTDDILAAMGKDIPYNGILAYESGDSYNQAWYARKYGKNFLWNESLNLYGRGAMVNVPEKEAFMQTLLARSVKLFLLTETPEETIEKYRVAFPGSSPKLVYDDGGLHKVVLLR
ncbi:MAG: hypothetical protein V3571_08650 [Pseudodesulfovibrio sp.]